MEGETGRNSHGVIDQEGQHQHPYVKVFSLKGWLSPNSLSMVSRTFTGIYSSGGVCSWLFS